MVPGDNTRRGVCCCLQRLTGECSNQVEPGGLKKKKVSVFSGGALDQRWPVPIGRGG